MRYHAHIQELVNRISRARWLLGLITEDCKNDKEYRNNSWVPGEVPDWFLWQSPGTGNPEERVDISSGRTGWGAMTHRNGASPRQMDIQDWSSRSLDWENTFENHLHLTEFQAGAEGSVRRLRGKINVKTEPYIMFQNKNKDPAKEPTNDVRERRRINQESCGRHRRNGSRRIANGIKPIREEKGENLKSPMDSAIAKPLLVL